MKFKKFLALGLAAAMAVSVAACGKTDAPASSDAPAQSSAAAEGEEAPAGKPVITLMSMDHSGHAFGNDGSAEILDYVKEFTGVDVQYRPESNDTYDDKLGIVLMDKANMPMIITYGSDLKSNIVQAAKDGAFWDLNEFVWDAEKYPYLSQMNKGVTNRFTVDGQLVGVYRSRPIGRNGIGYRADWAEKLGLDEPKTVEDIYEMMYQFTYGDPDGNGKDDTYGLCLCKYTGPFDIIQTWFGVGNGWVEKDGQLVPIHQTEEYMEALNWLKKMYEDGLVYDDWATRDTTTWTDGMKNGECGMYIDVLDGSRRIWDYFVDNNVPSVTGEGTASIKFIGAIAKDENSEPKTLATSGAAGCFLITKDGAKTVEDVEACLQYLDRMNAPEMRLLADYGLEGRDYTIDENGYVVDNHAGLEVEKKPANGFNQTVPYVPEQLEGLPTVEKSPRLIEEEALKKANEANAVFNPAAGYLVSSKIMAEVGTDLDDILSRARTQYICGQIDEEGLKEQFEVWAQRGGNDLIAEVNEMYAADQSK